MDAIQGTRGSERKENTGNNRREGKKQDRCSGLESEIVLEDLAKAPFVSVTLVLLGWQSSSHPRGNQ